MRYYDDSIVRGPRIGIAVRERRRQVLELRKAGLQFYAIGEHLGVSPQQAHKDFWEEMRALRSLSRDTAREVRDIELLRLDDMEQSIAQKVRAGDLDAINTSLRIKERRARYLGLDAPEAVDVHHSGPYVAEWAKADVVEVSSPPLALVGNGVGNGEVVEGEDGDGTEEPGDDDGAGS